MKKEIAYDNTYYKLKRTNHLPKEAEIIKKEEDSLPILTLYSSPSRKSFISRQVIGLGQGKAVYQSPFKHRIIKNFPFDYGSKKYIKTNGNLFEMIPQKEKTYLGISNRSPLGKFMHRKLPKVFK